MELFVVKVPSRYAAELWTPAPERELFFVEYDDKPECRRGDAVALELDGRIVGQATVAYLVAPGAQFQTWRLFWTPASFIPYS
ncbi:MAG: hypothetical protein HY423_02180 [Candidatus Lambdaproteobacteria bacterium]|nr:hypothetical protein [Candidatus Lambdaproteobacteria bacterium]